MRFIIFLFGIHLFGEILHAYLFAVLLEELLLLLGSLPLLTAYVGA